MFMGLPERAESRWRSATSARLVLASDSKIRRHGQWRGRIRPPVCVDKIDDAEVAHLDLSTWRTRVQRAEAIPCLDARRFHPSGSPKIGFPQSNAPALLTGGRDDTNHHWRDARLTAAIQIRSVLARFYGASLD